ncbi:MAG: 3-oxoacyl-[acyl-carrier-protein] reductase [Clostridia bacterium]|nr:3-oxoacyl-[acyl-carrier-protein] reductase [Clostridia bacterium]
MFNFTDKVAIVTGASSGIGKQTALQLAQGGADVAILFVGPREGADDAVAQIEAMGRKAVAYECNVADYDAAIACVEEVKKEFGRVDILVNNAGITRDNLVLKMTEADWDAVIDINLKGAFNMIKGCYRIFTRQRSGRIVNTASVSGIMGNPGQANYSASKAGLIGLTKTLAKELAGRNVTCNAVAPGFIHTPMTVSFDENTPLVQAIPLGKMGDPEDVANAICFLASDEAKYITGEVIRVDGGLAM